MGFLKNLFGKKEEGTKPAKPETEEAAAPQAEEQSRMYGAPLLTPPKVDDETQYYLTTARKAGEQIIIANIIIRDLADYSIRMRTILQSIRHSMEPL